MVDWVRKGEGAGNHDRRAGLGEGLRESRLLARPGAWQAHAIRDHSHETLASKADLHELELRLEVRFTQLEQRFETRFAQLEQKIASVQIGLIKWFTGIMIAQAGAIVALIKLLPGPS